ncbi:MAG: hypothetical protein HY902_06800 [Deltaproteobacteria bacterium]|nr:hypothetical protein [Deltaproteobacteria bacterium]
MQASSQLLLSVPGKLMIAGEYAVLRPAGVCLAVAVGRLVEVYATEGAPGVWLEAFGMRLDGNAASTGLGQFASAAARAAEQAWGIRAQGSLLLQVHGSQDGKKVGLGTSAAVTVATLRGLAALAGHGATADEVARLARSVHRQVQGAGSGYDVTTIAHGGCVAFDRHGDTTQALDWPQGLVMAAFFTGQAAPTAPALARVVAMGETLQAIDAAARELLALWPVAAPKTLMAALDHCEKALDVAAARVPDLLPPALQATRQFCREHGLVARTSGAGGGDCVLGCGPPAAVAAAVRSWRAGGRLVVAELPADLAPCREQ